MGKQLGFIIFLLHFNNAKSFEIFSYKFLGSIAAVDFKTIR